MAPRRLDNRTAFVEGLVHLRHFMSACLWRRTGEHAGGETLPAEHQSLAGWYKPRVMQRIERSHAAC
jgi:hypothetical protein